MKIDVKDIANGSLDGKVFWVCDLRYNDSSDKPIRHVPPTEVVVVTNGSTKVYYSQSHFRTLKKDRTPSSKVIKPYDNTGFRSYAGEPLSIYDNREECEEEYNRLVHKAIESVRMLLAELEDKILDLEELKV